MTASRQDCADWDRTASTYDGEHREWLTEAFENKIRSWLAERFTADDDVLDAEAQDRLWRLSLDLCP